MNQAEPTHEDLGHASREEIMSALFAHMVVQQSNMATMLLGKAPHPQTGQTVRDVEAAKLFIDQLEMLEVKTKGNLTKDEEQLLKQTLMALRMAFVEVVESSGAPTHAESAAPSGPSKEAEPAPTAAAAEGEDEPKKKFSKKY
jgi:hypothetical protein